MKQALMKENIITEAAKLFATKTYDSVTIRDISKKINIKSPSLYNHFNSKEDILTAILLRFKENYIKYFENSREIITAENDFIKIIDIMFASLRTIDNEFMYYGMTIIMKEQFHNKLAKDLAAKLFYKDSIEYIKSSFDYMVEKKIIKPCNSKAIATFFMFSVLVGTEIRIQNAEDNNFNIDIDGIYETLYNFIIDIIKT